MRREESIGLYIDVSKIVPHTQNTDLFKSRVLILKLFNLCVQVIGPNICSWFCAQGTIVQEASVGGGAVGAREIVLDLCVRGVLRM